MPPLLVVVSLFAQAAPPAITWKPVAPGVDYAAVQVEPNPTISDGRFHLVRISAAADLQVVTSSEDGHEALTAAEWSRKKSLAVVFNAGMFELDRVTHTGAFEIAGRSHGTGWLGKYKSVLVRQAKTELLDADTAPATDKNTKYLIQNLRLIRRPGRNVWSPGPRKWSEAALAVTKNGDLLFVFTRTPLTMYDFNERLLHLGLGVDAAMHLEGGPEASLSIHGGGIDLDLAGSYETGFFENDSNQVQWALPNVLGVPAPK